MTTLDLAALLALVDGCPSCMCRSRREAFEVAAKQLPLVQVRVTFAGHVIRKAPEPQ